MVFAEDTASDSLGITSAHGAQAVHQTVVLRRLPVVLEAQACQGEQMGSDQPSKNQGEPGDQITIDNISESEAIALGRGAMAIKAGGNVTIFNGQVLFQVLGGVDRALASHIRIRAFQSLINERTEGFVGREFIFRAIDRLLLDQTFTCGYIVIQGEPGIGKTALIGELVNRYGYVHHFNIAAQNIRSASEFLANVCAQLIARYELNYAALPEEATKGSVFLSQLLAEAAEKAGDRPVIVLVDALDEAEDTELPAEANRLYLPPTLPVGVFFIITTREEYDYRLAVDRREDIYMKDDDPQNVEDVRRYMLSFIAQHQAVMDLRINEWGISESEFVQVVLEKSQGNFMYLVQVLRDISSGKLSKDTVGEIRKLPQGLLDYYKRHWRVMKARDPIYFTQHQQPVVCMLATVREPVTVSQLAEWTKLSPTDIGQVIVEWYEFLDVDEPDEGERLYRIYHASFQDFLREEVGLSAYHQVIAATALGKINQETSARVNNPVAVLSNYELRNLVGHLENAEQLQDVHYLLALETRTEHNAWYEAKERHGDIKGYLADIKRAWQLAARESTRTLHQDGPRTHLALEVRYALISATMNSLAANMPATLLVALIQHNIWSCEQGIAYASLVPNPSERMEALVNLAEVCASSREQSFRAALAAAQSIEDIYWREAAIAALAPRLPPHLQHYVLARQPVGVRSLIMSYSGRSGGKEVDSQTLQPPREDTLQEQLAATLSMDETARVEKLTALLPRLNGQMLSNALQVATSIKDVFKRTLAVTQVVLRQVELGLLDDALRASTEIAFTHNRAEALSRFIHTSLEMSPDAVLREGLPAVQNISNPYWRAAALAELVSRLPALQRGDILLEALTATRTIGDVDQCDAVVSSISTCLCQSGAVDAAVAAVQAIQSEHWQAAALIAMASQVPDATVEKLLSIARTMTDLTWRVHTLVHLAPRVPELSRSVVFAEVLEHAMELEDQNLCKAITDLAPHLPEPLGRRGLRYALDAALASADEHRRAEMLATLALYLPAEMLSEALSSVQTMADEEDRSQVMALLAESFATSGQTSIAYDLAMHRIIDPYWREEAFTRVAQRLATSSHLQASLEVVRHITYDHWLVAVLAAQAPIASKAQLATLIRRARSIGDLLWRAIALNKLYPYVSKVLQESIQQEVFVTLRMLRDSDAWEATLVEISPDLPAPLLDEVLQMTEQLESSKPRVATLERLLLRLCALGRAQQALEMAQATTDPYMRARLLTQLLTHLTSEQRRFVLTEVCEIIQALPDARQQLHVVLLCTPYLDIIPIDSAYSCWDHLLRSLGTWDRQTMLAALENVLALLVRLGDLTLLIDVVHTIQEIHRWWP